MDREVKKPLHELISPAERVFLTISLMIGVFMAILDTTIVDIVVPKMMAPLSTDLYGVQWVITSYMTAAATGIFLVESLEGYLGLKKVFILGMILFTSASFMAGQAESLGWMIVARVVQGLGESFIVVSAEAMLFSAYPPEKRGLAMGIYGMGVSFAPALGPTLGGYITENINWRWIFYINIPIGIINVVLALFFLRDYKGAHKKLNLVSFAFLSMATVFLLITLSKGQQYGWWSSDFIIYTTLLSIFFFLLFLLSELISKNPLIDPEIFKIPEFNVASLVYFLLLGFSMYQVFYMIPLYYENLKLVGTFHAGLYILPMALAIGFFSPIAGFIADKKSDVAPLVFASILYVYLLFFVIPKFNYFTPSLSASLHLIPLGIAMGFFFAPITNLALKHLGDKTTLGVSIMHYLRFVGGSFGTALATNHLQASMWQSFQSITELQNTHYADWYLKGIMNQMALYFHNYEEKAKAMLYQVQMLYASSDAFQEVFLYAGFWGLLGSLPILYLVYIRTSKRLRPRGQES